MSEFVIYKAAKIIKQDFSVPMSKYWDGKKEQWVVVDDDGLEVLRTAHNSVASFFVETTREKIKP